MNFSLFQNSINVPRDEKGDDRGEITQLKCALNFQNFETKIALNLIVIISTKKSAKSAPLRKVDAKKVPKGCWH